MADMKKVVNGLRCCSEMSGEYCRKCPYQDECRDSYGIPHLANDALELLKEQDELLHKKQKDINRLCNEISEWKHKFHDTPKEQEASGWVSVKDRMPESYGNYLVRVGKSGKGWFNPQTKTAYWMPDKKVWKGTEAYSVFTDVSHWMPLPEPPMEVSE